MPAQEPSAHRLKECCIDLFAKFIEEDDVQGYVVCFRLFDRLFADYFCDVLNDRIPGIDAGFHEGDSCKRRRTFFVPVGGTRWAKLKRGILEEIDGPVDGSLNLLVVDGVGGCGQQQQYAQNRAKPVDCLAPLVSS